MILSCGNSCLLLRIQIERNRERESETETERERGRGRVRFVLRNVIKNAVGKKFHITGMKTERVSS